ncbi:MAG TPA: HEAT repeat domain-containing protein [Verrucomicrobiae bacterium]|nr:HEAT repeat domain-containing protein [Verrucomicrobiae bacterium]
MKVCFLIAFLCLAVIGCRREPVYHGKPLQHWVSLLQDQNLDFSPAPDAVEAEKAVQAIGPAAIPWLIEWTKHPPNSTVETPPAFKILGLQAASAIPELGEILSHRPANLDDDDSFEQAAAAISYLGPSAIPYMFAAVTNASVDLGQVIQNFGNLGTNGVSVIPALIAWTSDSNPEARIGAIGALGGIAMKPESVVPVLRVALKAQEPLVRREAANSLGSYGNAAKDALPDLIPILNDSDAETRDNAIEALGKIGGEPGVVLPLLVKKLNDPDGDVRFVAALALGDLGGQKAFDALMQATDDPDREVREAVFHSLNKIDSEQLAKSGKTMH